MAPVSSTGAPIDPALFAAAVTDATFVPEHNTTTGALRKIVLLIATASAAGVFAHTTWAVPERSASTAAASGAVVTGGAVMTGGAVACLGALLVPAVEPVSAGVGVGATWEADSGVGTINDEPCGGPELTDVAGRSAAYAGAAVASPPDALVHADTRHTIASSNAGIGMDRRRNPAGRPEPAGTRWQVDTVSGSQPVNRLVLGLLEVAVVDTSPPP